MVDLPRIEGDHLGDSASLLGSGKEDSVVRPDESGPCARGDAKVASPPAHPWVHDNQVDGIGQLVDPGGSDGRALPDVEWRYLVTQIDDLDMRTCVINDRMTYADQVSSRPKSETKPMTFCIRSLQIEGVESWPVVDLLHVEDTSFALWVTIVKATDSWRMQRCSKADTTP